MTFWSPSVSIADNHKYKTTPARESCITAALLHLCRDVPLAEPKDRSAGRDPSSEAMPRPSRYLFRLAFA